MDSVSFLNRGVWGDLAGAVNGWWDFTQKMVIVSASRSPPGLDSKGSTCEAHFRLAPKRVDFWSSFSHSGGLFGVIFGPFFGLWERFGSAGAPIFDHKSGLSHQRVFQEAFPQKYIHSLGPIWRSFLEYFLIFGALFLSIVFC